MVDEKKKIIRQKIKELKNQLSNEEKVRKSYCVFQKIETTDWFINAKTIMLYWSMNDEVQTHDFVQKWADKKEIILPSVNGNELILKKFNGINKMVKGESFGIPEPDGEFYPSPELIDVIIVPGVAFDKQNNRLGRGKAFYDKLLKTVKAKKVGVCFDFQMIDQVPTGEFDIKMDSVVCDD